MKTLGRVLIANRGEIAVRIARGARASGIVPLGIYSDADADAMHLDAMDDAAAVGPAPAVRSYLDIARVIAAAKTLRADAIHPGYGFLSERAEFAAAVRDAGLIFVGPSPESIAAMGDKTEAKRRARANGVPVVPGYDGDDESVATLRAQAALIGTPLLIKASAGGGGRGMRVVADLAAFDEALEAARREALAAFGDARVLLEKYLVRPRHVEFQIVADAYGTTVHLGERECSIQRRHQKIVEEAPSTALDADLRARMGEAAVRVARSVGYENAGTVEFLLDAAGAFYFLEMNARLQVEHPVTELVHGVDLVRLQFAIAAGAPLDLAAGASEGRGWAIEARINAEDPARDFLPAAGTLARFDAPAGDGIRLDAGVRTGSTVSIYYDSLLAKLVAYGPDRRTAAARLASALAALRIEGVRTNVALLEAIARDDAFLAGDTTTAFLTERAAALAAAMTRVEDDAFELAVAAVLTDSRSWRIAGAGIAVRLRTGERTIATTGSRLAGPHAWRWDGDFAGEVEIERSGDRVVLRRGETRLAGRATVDAAGVALAFDGATRHVAFAAPPALGSGGSARRGAGAVISPMPGKIARVAVRAGDQVEERDLLVVLEAMKMEHRIEATRAGTVASVIVAEGALVAGGATLVEIA